MTTLLTTTATMTTTPTFVDEDTVISATTDLISLYNVLPDLSNALGERNRTYTDTSPLGVNPYLQGLT